MIIKFMKYWVFDNFHRKETTLLSQLVRLNAEREADPFLQLKAVDGEYSTLADLAVRTSQYHPQALVRWDWFDFEWDSTEPDFKEYPMELSDKAVDNFIYESPFTTPRIGDRLYQGDNVVTITNVDNGRVYVSDGALVANGQVVAIRSQTEVGFHIVAENGDIWWWDGAAWAVGDMTKWNTGYQIHNHISGFPLATTGKKLRVDVNLKTNDKRYTPRVREVKLLGDFDLESYDDIIYDSLIPLIEEEIIVSTQIDITLRSATDTIDLGGDYQLEKVGHNFTDIEIAYNLTSDPNRTLDISQSYTPGAARRGGGNDPGVVKLSSVQPAGSVISLKLKYFPEIAINTSVDFYEVTTTPMIVFEKITIEDKAEGSTNAKGDYVRDKFQLSGVQLEPPAHSNIIFEYAVFTGSQTDQHRLGEALHRFFSRNKTVTSWGLDQPYPINVDEIFSTDNKANTSDVNTHKGRFTIEGVMSFLKEPKNVALVGNFVRGITTNS